MALSKKRSVKSISKNSLTRKKRKIQKVHSAPPPNSKPWLGHQEALYAGLRWHLKVPRPYTKQFSPAASPPRIVFPGEAHVNNASGPRASVELEGHIGGWVTDMELATCYSAKLYGFDFSRVTEIWDYSPTETRIMPQLDPASRNNSLIFPQAELNMMEDLILSTLFKDGEVCISYHLLNPFFSHQQGIVLGKDIGTYLTFEANSANFAGGLDMHDITDLGASNMQLPRQYLSSRFTALGDMINRILSNSNILHGKDIYVRLFHEPNIGYFWWGQNDKTAPSSNFIANYHRLWNFAVNIIRARITAGNNLTKPQQEERVKFVFCPNAEDDPAILETRLNAYIPANSQTLPPGLPPEAAEFIQNINILGLDYYEEFDSGAQSLHPSNLDAQYQEIVAKANALGKRHALTEVGVRNDFSGKLYTGWPAANRNFFATSVKTVADNRNPEWVMFWANRFGNSALTNYTPINSGTQNASGLYYGSRKTNGDCVNLLNPILDSVSADAIEMFIPTSPSINFDILTYEAGQTTTTVLNIKGGIESFKYIQGAVHRSWDCNFVTPLSPTPEGQAMLDVVNDFHLMMGQGQTFATL